ncbi:MAG: glutaminyl-peptide cyclotransferase [Chloroflexota bacterium]
MRRLSVFFILLLITVTSTSCTSEQVPPPTFQPVVTYTYKVINTYPHNRTAFTQGLVFENGVLYESTGLYGKSSLRKVSLETGKVLQIRQLFEYYFGEGITIYKNKIILLTWESHVGFIYDKDRFDLLGDFSYPGEGWGITYDGESLIMSDGTSTLRFLNPETLEATGSVQVRENGAPVTQINELEYIEGKIYANIWQTDKIAIIEPEDGRVTGWIDLSGLLPQSAQESANVLNGIAYDAKAHRLFVTGKFWPLLFEIELVPKQ